MGKNRFFPVLRSTPTWETYTTAGLAVVTNISYGVILAVHAWPSSVVLSYNKLQSLDLECCTDYYVLFEGLICLIVLLVGEIYIRAMSYLMMQYNIFKHDVLNLFSDLFSDNNQNLSFFSEFIFNSHYMFRRSGPGHMLLHTVILRSQSEMTFSHLSPDKISVNWISSFVLKIDDATNIELNSAWH